MIGDLPLTCVTLDKVARSYTVYLPGCKSEMNLLIQNAGPVGVNKNWHLSSLLKDDTENITLKALSVLPMTRLPQSLTLLQ